MYDILAKVVTDEGPAKAFDRLIEHFAESKEHHRLFDALVMKARHELGLPLVQIGASSSIPPIVRDVYEEHIIAACRRVGDAFLRDSDIPTAFQYYNMIGDLGPVKDAIEAYQPREEQDPQEIIQIAVHHGVHPVRGMELVLENYGICNAITTCEGLLHQGGEPAAKIGCVQRLVRSLFEQLIDRLQADIAEREGTAPTIKSVTLLIKDRPALFANDNYHVDTSHLSSVVRMARVLPRCDELIQAIQLCEYGRRLSERYRYPEPAPFENVYDDGMAFLKVLAGQEVDKGLAHFRQKAEQANPQEVGTQPAETYLHLLTAVNRIDEAIKFAASQLARHPDHAILNRSLNELCQSNRKFSQMADIARQRDDLVTFLAGKAQEATPKS